MGCPTLLRSGESAIPNYLITALEKWFISLKNRGSKVPNYSITIPYLVLIDVFRWLWLNAQRVKCYNRSCTPSRKPPWDTLFFLLFLFILKIHYTIKNNKISSSKSFRPRSKSNYINIGTVLQNRKS